MKRPHVVTVSFSAKEHAAYNKLGAGRWLRLAVIEEARKPRETDPMKISRRSRMRTPLEERNELIALDIRPCKLIARDYNLEPGTVRAIRYQYRKKQRTESKP